MVVCCYQICNQYLNHGQGKFYDQGYEILNGNFWISWFTTTEIKRQIHTAANKHGYKKDKQTHAHAHSHSHK